jgi:hypothetical protein
MTRLEKITAAALCGLTAAFIVLAQVDIRTGFALRSWVTSLGQPAKAWHCRNERHVGADGERHLSRKCFCF